MKYSPIGAMRKADANYRERGGRWRNTTHLTGRRMWWRDSVRRSSVMGFDPEELTVLEKAVYQGLAPQMSSFALLEEACILHAPQIEEQDPRAELEWFQPKARGRFSDPNHGQPIFTVGLRRHHGDACGCYECIGYPEDEEE